MAKKSQSRRASAVQSGTTRSSNKKQQKKADKQLAMQRPALSGSFKLTFKSAVFFRDNFGLLAGITAVYLALDVLMVRGLSGGIGSGELKTNFDDAINGGSGELGSALRAFGKLVGSAGSSGSQSGSVIQSLLVILVSLATIITLRKLFAGSKQTVKQAYYGSTSQLVPFLIVLFVVALQAIPLMLGSAIFNALAVSVAPTGTGFVVGGLLFVIGCWWSLYLLSASAFALFIVTLPDTTPLQALRSAKKLVRFRRFAVIRKALFLPLLVFVVLAVVVVPFVMFATGLAEPVFYIFSGVALIYANIYFYYMYRELIA